MIFRVNSLATAGTDRVLVNFNQVNEVATENTTVVAPYGTGNLSINLSSEEAKGFWPGQDYTLTLTALESA